MGHSVAAAATALLAIVPCKAIAETVRPVGWAELLDASAQQFEDPYRDLTPQQMSDLLSLVRMREMPSAQGLGIEERERLETQTAELEAALDAARIDVEWLISQRWVVAERRRQAAVGVNRSLDGQPVEITGFLITAPPSESGEVTGYLMPDRDLCLHLPAPPPNQLLRLVMTGVPENVGACTPAAVRGTLLAEETRGNVFVIDDTVPMWSAWTLESVDVRSVRSSAP